VVAGHWSYLTFVDRLALGSVGVPTPASGPGPHKPGRYRLAEVAFDPWRFGQGAQELAQRGVRVVAFPQSDARMLPASDRLYRAIVEHRLTLPDDDELRAHVGAAIAKHSRRGWRIDKAGRADQIAVVALAMAVDAKEQAPAPVELLAWI
jgi:phage terminase large subunit-like protein